MNRRDFVLRSSLVVSATLLPRSFLFSAESITSSSKPPSDPKSSAAAPSVTEFRPLRRGVGIFTGRGGTIGWLSNKEALAVVDTQFPDTAAVCLAGLPDSKGRQIDVVLNTHHHPDHTSGNGVFKAASKTIVAHQNVPALQFARAEKDGKIETQVFADTTFSDAWRHDLGDETVTAQYFGPAHTKGDIVVHFTEANVIHLGDLAFNRRYPVIDRVGGANIRHWISVLEDITKTYPADSVYVFGHANPKFGVTGGHPDILAFRDYLSALLAHVEKEIAAGKAKNQIVTLDNFPGFPDLHTPLPNGLGSNLSVAYDELTSA